MDIAELKNALFEGGVVGAGGAGSRHMQSFLIRQRQLFLTVLNVNH